MNTQTIIIEEDQETRKLTVTGHDFTMAYAPANRPGRNDTWETTHGHNGFHATIQRKDDTFRTKVHNPWRPSYHTGTSPTLEKAFESVHSYIAQRTA